jgi:hypothetical protein
MLLPLKTSTPEASNMAVSAQVLSPFLLVTADTPLGSKLDAQLLARRCGAVQIATTEPYALFAWTIPIVIDSHQGAVSPGAFPWPESCPDWGAAANRSALPEA